MGDEADRIIEDGELNEIFGDAFFVENDINEGSTCPSCEMGNVVELKDEQGKYFYCPVCKTRWT